MCTIHFSGTGGDPKAEARPNGGNAVSYNVIDSQSPPYFVNTSRSMVSGQLLVIIVFVAPHKDFSHSLFAIYN